MRPADDSAGRVMGAIHREPHRRPAVTVFDELTRLFPRLAWAATVVIGLGLASELLANPDLIWTRIERALAADLKLNPEQSATVHRILSETHDQVRNLRTEYQPRVLPMIEKARADIAATLTPEQRAKFDKLLKEKERLWKR